MTAVASQMAEVFFGERELEISSLRIDPDQIRFELDEIELARLAKNIDAVGMLSPVTVMPDGEGYRLICGERRVRAALLAGWKEVPTKCLPPLNSTQVIETRFEENQRQKRMTRLEIALTVNELLMRRLNIEADEVSTSISKYIQGGKAAITELERETLKDIFEQSGIAPLEFYKRFVPMLSLDSRYIDLIRNRRISERKMLVIKGIPNSTQREAVLQQVLEEGLTEQQLEGIRRAAVQKDQAKPGKRERLIRKNLVAFAKEFSKLSDDQQNEVEAMMRRMFEKVGFKTL